MFFGSFGMLLNTLINANKSNFTVKCNLQLNLKNQTLTLTQYYTILSSLKG